MTHIFLFFAPWTKTKWFIKFAITHHSCDIYLKTLQVLVTLVKNVLIVHMTTFHHYLLLKNVDLKILLIKSILVGASCVNGSCCKKPLCSVTTHYVSFYSNCPHIYLLQMMQFLCIMNWHHTDLHFRFSCKYGVNLWHHLLNWYCVVHQMFHQFFHKHHNYNEIVVIFLEKHSSKLDKPCNVS